MSYYGVDYPNYYLAHYRTKGATNKRHKYVAIKNGQYIYDTPTDRSDDFKRVVTYRGTNDKIDPKALNRKKSPSVGQHNTHHGIHDTDRMVRNVNPFVTRAVIERNSRPKRDMINTKAEAYRGPAGQQNTYSSYQKRQRKVAEDNARRNLETIERENREQVRDSLKPKPKSPSVRKADGYHGPSGQQNAYRDHARREAFNEARNRGNNYRTGENAANSKKMPGSFNVGWNHKNAESGGRLVKRLNPNLNRMNNEHQNGYAPTRETNENRRLKDEARKAASIKEEQRAAAERNAVRQQDSRNNQRRSNSNNPANGEILREDIRSGPARTDTFIQQQYANTYAEYQNALDRLRNAPLEEQRPIWDEIDALQQQLTDLSNEYDAYAAENPLPTDFLYPLFPNGTRQQRLRAAAAYARAADSPFLPNFTLRR